ncbi:hypothetical protein HanPSC8_Chr04g0168071 [Helianthus annuus]|nr:hypothetical protein HanPSC8_Chr04g0168071 [Helianthus annuus]
MGASYVGMSSVPTGIENPQNGYWYPRFGTGILGSVPVFEGRTGKYWYQKTSKVSTEYISVQEIRYVFETGTLPFAHPTICIYSNTSPSTL